jgi:hypothetical protein
MPLKEMPCEVYPGAAALRFESVNTSDPLKLPAAVGAKLIENAQEAPAASVPGAEELLSTTGQELGALPARVKFVVMLGLLPVAGTGKDRSALPAFSSVTVCGLSVLVEPTGVLAKVRLGGSA